MKDPAAKILTLEAAVAWRRRLRESGATLAVCNGCYDLLHAGHLRGLLEARRQADALLVLLNSDASVRALKGEGRPFVPQDGRALLLAGLACVSAVVVFDMPRCDLELSALAPDIYCISEAYARTQDPGEAAVLAGLGIPTHWLPLTPGLSTTALAERIRKGPCPFPPPGRTTALPGPIPVRSTPHPCGVEAAVAGTGQRAGETPTGVQRARASSGGASGRSPERALAEAGACA